MSDNDSTPSKGIENTQEQPRNEVENRSNNWIDIARSTRSTSAAKAKNTTPIAKLHAQWKSMKATNYAFHNLRKFTEAMLKAGDNTSEIYSISPELVVQILTSGTQDDEGLDIIYRYQRLLESIVQAVAKFVQANTPEDVSETNEELSIIAELKAAKVAGDKKLIGELLKKLVSE